MCCCLGDGGGVVVKVVCDECELCEDCGGEGLVD